MEQVCYECAQGYSRSNYDAAMRMEPHCEPYHHNHCYTAAMADANKHNTAAPMYSFASEYSSACVDHCMNGLVPNFREMKCECPRGMYAHFKANCDVNDPACFEGCKCYAGSTMQGTQCKCDDPNQYVSLNGCVNDHSNDCHMPMSGYSKDHNACRMWEVCPMADPMFEGCKTCGMTNKFDGKPFPMECFDCAAGYVKL
jgi:hypothetical protein